MTDIVKWRADLSRADRAALRRLADPADAVFVPATYALRTADVPLSVVCQQAVVLAEADGDCAGTLAGTLAAVGVSETRMRQLLAADRTRAVELLRSLVRRAEHAPLAEVADTVRWWGNATKRRLAADWYTTTTPTPTTTEDSA